MEEPRAGAPDEPDRTDASGETPSSASGDGAAPAPPPLRRGRGRGTRPMDPDRPCMNCGDPTPGEYCPTCGQRKVDVQVSVRTLVMEVLEDQFILDKRLPRTLGALLFKPGHMTVEHVNGRIVRYIHPFRLYLVTSLVFFVLLSFFSMRLVRQAVQEDDGPAVAVTADSLEREVAGVDSALARIDRQMADTANPAPVREALAATRTPLERRRMALLARLDSLPAADADTVAPDTTDPDAAAGRTSGGASGGAAEPATLSESFGWDGNPPEVNVPGPAVLDSALAGQVRRLGAMTPREAGETLVGTFFNYAPTMMFILLPVFAGVLKLLYIRRGRYYAEHFVFLLHVHSFVFLLATVMLLLSGWAGGTWVELGLWLWILVYIYLAMKRVYGQGWFVTFVKYWTLGWMYFWILVFSVPIAFFAALLLF